MGGQKPFKNRFPGAKKSARCRQNHDGLTLALRVTKFSEGDISGRKAKLTSRTQFDPSIKRGPRGQIDFCFSVRSSL